MAFVWHKGTEKPIPAQDNTDDSSVSVIIRRKGSNEEYNGFWCDACVEWHTDFGAKVYQWRYMNEDEWNRYNGFEAEYVNPDEELLEPKGSNEQ